MKLEFIKSPTCEPFMLGYSIGDVADIKDKELADKLIEKKFAIPATSKKPEGEKANNKKTEAGETR